MATSSEELAAQADQLKELISFFKVGKGQQEIVNRLPENASTSKNQQYISNTFAQKDYGKGKEYNEPSPKKINLDLSSKENKDKDFESF